MSKEELELDTITKIKQLDEAKLKMVNDYLYSLDNKNLNISVISHALSIINERSSVLDKLAQ